ncbi:MAG: hypothetical protein GY730_08600 [bacterium]|nr:hypothetical protein [bacterium]
MKETLILLFFGFLFFLTAPFVGLAILIQDADTALYLYFYIFYSYCLLCISVICFKLLDGLSLVRKLFYSGFSPAMSILYAYTAISIEITTKNNYQPYYFIFQLLVAITGLYLLFLLIKSPIKWYFKIVIGAYILYLPYLYIVGGMSICGGV